ncbi:MAG: sulfatase-like hydrolase/transferase [bacterium JZ-2024 1]
MGYEEMQDELRQSACATSWLIETVRWCDFWRGSRRGMLLAVLLVAFGSARGAFPGSLPENVRLIRNVEYARAGDVSLTLDIYEPKYPVRNPTPAVIWIHGGAWKAGDKFPAPLAVQLAQQGFFAVSINYRLSDVAKFPAAVHDSKCAVRWVRAHATDYGVDPDHIGVGGASAGGHLALMVGLTQVTDGLEPDFCLPGIPTRVNAVLSYFGPTNLTRAAPVTAGVVVSFLGATPRENPDLYWKASPIAYVSSDDPPVLMVHGDSDELVGLSQSQELLEALKGRTEAQLVVVRNAGHGFQPVAGKETDPSRKEIHRISIEFFKKHLLRGDATKSDNSAVFPAPGASHRSSASSYRRKVGDTRPNIVFILSDDQRWDTLGAYGNRDIRTPNLDRLASRGALFTAGYVAAPLCCPSRATFLTGLYPHQTGVDANRKRGGHARLPDDVVTVAHYLNRAGYVTGFVGKAHLAGGPSAYGFAEAPLYLPGGGSRHENPSLIVGGHLHFLPGKLRKNDLDEDEYYTPDGSPQRVEGLITPLFADAAIQFLETHRQDLFFLWLATTAPHTPHYRDPKHVYKPEEIHAPPGWADTSFVAESKDWTGYYSTISHMDEHLGRVLARLEDLGLFENTVVIFSSDNGFMMGSHNLPAKAVWYEESIRVPWIIAWKGRIAPATIVRTPVSSVDFLPTVLDLAGIPIPEGYEGVSILPALGLKEGSIRKVVYSEVRGGQRTLPSGTRKRRDRWEGMLWQAVKTNDFKYVRFEDGTELLYDLRTDPMERTDVSKDPRYAKALEDLRAEWVAWQNKTPPAFRPTPQFLPKTPRSHERARHTLP